MRTICSFPWKLARCWRNEAAIHVAAYTPASIEKRRRMYVVVFLRLFSLLAATATKSAVSDACASAL